MNNFDKYLGMVNKPTEVKKKQRPSKKIKLDESMDMRDDNKITMIDAYIDGADAADLYDLLADFNITEGEDISDLDEAEVKEYLRDHLMGLDSEDLKEVLGQD